MNEEIIIKNMTTPLTSIIGPVIIVTVVQILLVGLGRAYYLEGSHYLGAFVMAVNAIGVILNIIWLIKECTT